MKLYFTRIRNGDILWPSLFVFMNKQWFFISEWRVILMAWNVFMNPFKFSWRMYVENVSEIFRSRASHMKEIDWKGFHNRQSQVVPSSHLVRKGALAYLHRYRRTTQDQSLGSASVIWQYFFPTNFYYDEKQYWYRVTMIFVKNLNFLIHNPTASRSM